jgi:hypothetical protein
MTRILTGREIVDKEFVGVKGLTSKFTKSFGDIEDSFSCIISGESGNGKTSMVNDLLKELMVLGDVLYLGLEEGFSKSFSNVLSRSGLDLEKIKVIADCDFAELCNILDRRMSPKIVVIDSIQYMGLSYPQYKQFKRKYLYGRKGNARKILIMISHSKGKTIDGKAAFSIRHDCMVKVFVKGFIGFVISRFECKQNYIVWEQGAKAFWGKKYNDVIAEIGKSKVKKTVKKPKKNADENTATQG